MKFHRCVVLLGFHGVCMCWRGGGGLGGRVCCRHAVWATLGCAACHCCRGRVQGGSAPECVSAHARLQSPLRCVVLTGVPWLSFGVPCTRACPGARVLGGVPAMRGAESVDGWGRGRGGSAPACASVHALLRSPLWCVVLTGVPCLSSVGPCARVCLAARVLDGVQAVRGAKSADGRHHQRSARRHHHTHPQASPKVS